MRRRFLSASILSVALVAMMSAALVAVCGRDSTGTPTVTGRTTATSTPFGTAGTPSASGTRVVKPATKILAATTCRSIDAGLNPVDPTSTFGPNDTVYLSVDLEDFPQGTKAGASWYFGDQFLNSFVITAKKDYATTRISFNLKPTTPFAPGRYRAEIYLNDYLSETVQFSVTENPPTSTAAPSTAPAVTPSSTPSLIPGGTSSVTETPTPGESATGTPTPGETFTATPTPSAETTAAPSPTPSATPPSPSPTPGGPQTFSSQSLHISLTYPQNWTVQDGGSSVTFTSPEPNVAFSVSSRQGGPNDTVEGLNAELIDNAKRQHPDLTVQGNQSVGISGETWLETDSVYTGDNGIKQTLVDLVCLRNGTPYFIVMTAPQSTFDQQRQAAFQSMRDNFKFN